MTSELLEAETCLRDAWPAADDVDCHGWRLRATAGGYVRANSVWPGMFNGEIATAIAEAEAFYATRGLSARFQVFDTAEPAGLDAALAERGYASDPPCSTLAKPVAGSAAAGDVVLTAEPTASWLGVYEPLQSAERAAELPGILARLPRDHVFLVAHAGGGAVAVALAVNIAGTVAIDCVATDPQARRTGAATRVMLAADAWAMNRAARRLVLHVVDANHAAAALYARLGYARVSGYHYRVR